MKNKIRWMTTVVRISALIIIMALPALGNELKFKVLFVGQQTLNNQDSIAVTFSAAIDGSEDFNRFINLFSVKDGSVDGAWILTDDKKTAYFTNIEADTDYEIQIRRGILAEDGRTLISDAVHKLRTRPVKASISFTGSGSLLPADLNRGLPVTTLNVPEVDVDFFRVKDRFLVDFIKNFSYSNTLYHYQNDELKRFTRLVYSARFDLDAPKNVKHQAILPLDKIDGINEPGIYFAVMRQAGSYDYANAATYFTISDIGVHLRIYTGQIKVITQHLGSGAVYEGVEVSLLDTNGNVLSRKRTDPSGQILFTGLNPKPELLLAQKDGHTTMLSLAVPAMDLSGFDLGLDPFRPVELFVYGPRDLYRPGEIVIMDGLLRDYDGRNTLPAPVSMTLIQPDGKRSAPQVLHPDPLNAIHTEYALSTESPTGTWTAEFMTGKKMLQLYRFRVEDFMPERMKLTLIKKSSDTLCIKPAEPIAMAIEGMYLYGAPAAGNRVDCSVRMSLLRNPLEAFPGFEFGNIDETFMPQFNTKEILLDDQGKGVIQADNLWKEINSPLTILLEASLYESGGRPVTRHQEYCMWPGEALVGIRPSWEGERVDANGSATFDIILTDRQGNLLSAEKLHVTLIREYPDYYWEYSNGWQRIVNYQHYPVFQSILDIKAGQKATLDFQVEWGPYRLEVKNPETGLMTSYRFNAGWNWWGESGANQASRPDQVVLTLDKAAYRPGDTAAVLVKAPEDGMALIMVEGGTPVWQKILPVTANGTTVEIPIASDWDRHDLYISAMVIRAGDVTRKITPKRSIGLIHLPLDRTQRHLDVTLDAPEKARANTSVPVRIKIPGKLPEDGLSVTLAAVDVGVLAITGFKTPDPAGFFFSQRRYGADLHDVYQKLIESSEGSIAGMRYGGDTLKLMEMAMSAMTRGGARPGTQVRIVSLYHGPVTVSEDGTASILLDLPDFSGKLRLMAVAYGKSHYGTAESEMTVASPLVTQMAMPRFLAMGDKSFLALDVHNLSGLAQDLTIELATGTPLILKSPARQSLHLKENEKTLLRYQVEAESLPGISTIHMKILGIQADETQEQISLEREWRLGIRPAYPAKTRTLRKSIEPGEKLTIEAETLQNLIPETLAARMTLSSRPPINVSEHIHQLDAYPYGCLEQTLSGIYPHIYLDQAMLDQLDIRTRQEDAVRRDRVEKGIERLNHFQKPDGGFGLWSNKDPEDCWLTAYAADFLLNARDQGFSVSDQKLNLSLTRLQTYLQKPHHIQVGYSEAKPHTNFAVQAYSAFVLARTGRAPLGQLRTLFDNHQAECRSGLPLVHLGMALYLQGDHTRAQQAFDLALEKKQEKRIYLGDYGSPARDAAMAYTLLSSHQYDAGKTNPWLVKLDQALYERQWLSTQERNALVLAGIQILKTTGTPWQARCRVNASEKVFDSQGTVQQFFGQELVSQGLELEATGESPVYADIALNGYSRTRLTPEHQGMEVARSYFDLKGNPIDPSHLKTGDLVLVKLSVHSDIRVPQALVVDLLPAGLELENQNLPTSVKMDAIVVEDKPVSQWKSTAGLAHEEFRDDRYVAALDIHQGRTTLLFYLARAVSPGRFSVPNPLVEDMYRPYYRSVGDTLEGMIIEQP